VRLEFWVHDEIDIHLPVDSAVTRTTIPQREAIEATVERYGATWPTIEGMWDTLARDVDFPIDIVFSWVDGTDLEWQRARASRMQSYVIGEGDDHEARFRQLDELRYALRSVHLFAPWIRNIVIVTDSPRPEWLADHPRVAVLSSAEFFADSSVLPVYNSHAVESQLHRIPGLSEHFLYSNDDMFFGREVGPEAFFTSGGVSRFIEADTRIGLGDPETSRSGFENAARVNRALLQGRFGRTIARHLEHAPAPLRRSVLEELEAEFPAEFARTASSRFRSATDVSVTNSLYHYYALMTGRAVPQESMRVKYVDTTMRAGVAELGALLRRRDHDFFCLNDGSFPELTPDERAEAVRSFLEDYLPIAAPWERTVR
jgi:UDP-glucose 4-epimerase